MEALTGKDVPLAVDAKKPFLTKKALAIIAGVVVVVAVAGGVGGYFATHKSSSSSSSSSTTSGSSGSGSSSSGGNKLIGYWGQNSANNRLSIVNGTGGRADDQSLNQLALREYCDLKYYNTINLAFLTEFGGGDNHFTINLANIALYKWSGSAVTSGGNALITVGQDITYCQQNGVKIILSMGGDKVSNYSFASGDGERYANLFYNAFLGGSDTTVKPFGASVVLDGIELDIEKNAADVTSGADPSAWTPEMVTFVQTLKKLSPNSIISAVPQCSLTVTGYIGKDRNIGDLIAQTPSSFDYLIVQYYNNVECTYPFGFNFDSWKGLFSGKIYVGLPGDWISAISGGFLEPPNLQAVYNYVKGDSQFAGISLYDVSSSNSPGLQWNTTDYNDPPVSHYSQTVYNLLQGETIATAAAAPGEPQAETDYAYRCGGTWVYANATCGLATCNPYANTTGCATNQQCFRFLAKC